MGKASGKTFSPEAGLDPVALGCHPIAPARHGQTRAVRVLLGVITAAALAAAWNTLIPRVLGKPGLQYLVPLGEEAAKTLVAVLLAVSVQSVHVGFGLVEAVYETSLKPSTGVVAGAVAILLHTTLGLLTGAVLYRTGRVWPAIAVASIIHLIWNSIAARLGSGGPVRGR